MKTKILTAFVVILTLFGITNGVFVSKIVQGQSQICFSDDIRNPSISKQDIH